MVQMDENRLCRKIFENDIHLCKNNWASEVKGMFKSLNLEYLFDSKSMCDMHMIKQYIMDKNSELNMNKLASSVKLRMYKQFKNDNIQEFYLKLNLEVFERSLFAKLRLGVLPIRVETGRYNRELLSDRKCKLCNLNEIEDELHFICRCKLYSNLRKQLKQKIIKKFKDFDLLNELEQFVYMMKSEQRNLAIYVKNCFMMRRDTLYSK
jgi:hypothetical protein